MRRKPLFENRSYACRQGFWEGVRVDGEYLDFAGVSAGIDISLAMIDDLLGRKYTEAVMLDLEYDPKPLFFVVC